MTLLLILLMTRVLFSFLLKLNSQPLYVRITLVIGTEAELLRFAHNCYSVKNMLKRFVFKWLLNELLLETE